MRILYGSLKGKKINVPAKIRPVSGRVKKALISKIYFSVKEAVVGDFFAGSGALGFEALSCGAKKVFFIEQNIAVSNMLIKNIKQLELTNNCELIPLEIIKGIEYILSQKVKLDIVFLDPPYNQGLLKKALKTIDEYDIVSHSGRIYGLCFHHEPEIEMVNFYIDKIDIYGDTKLISYQKRK